MVLLLANLVCDFVYLCEFMDQLCRSLLCEADEEVGGFNADARLRSTKFLQGPRHVSNVFSIRSKCKRTSFKADSSSTGPSCTIQQCQYCS